MTRINGISRRCALQMVAGLASAKAFRAGSSVAADRMPPVTLRRLEDIAWQPLESTFFPPGLR